MQPLTVTISNEHRIAIQRGDFHFGKRKKLTVEKRDCAHGRNLVGIDERINTLTGRGPDERRWGLELG